MGGPAAASRGRRGYRRLAEALERVRPRTDSPRETELRLDIVAAGMPEPAVNAPLLDAGGRQLALGDLVLAEYRLVVEYDGEQHRTDDRQYARDIERLDDLAHAGYRVIRFTKRDHGFRRDETLDRVWAALVERGWQPPTRTT